MAWGVPKVGAMATVASGDLTLTEPASSASGDLMVACVALRGNVGLDTPSGWTKIAEELSGDTDATNGIASGQMFACIRGGSAPTLVFTRTGGDVAHGRIVSYTGAHATGWQGNASSITAASAATVVGAASITTETADELIVAMGSAGDTMDITDFDATDPGTNSGASSNTTTAPTAGTWFKRGGASTNTGADTNLGVGDGVRASAGTTGTINVTFNAGARHVVIAGAFRQTAAGPAERTGTATVALTLGNAATGTVEVQGSTTVPLTLGVNAAGGVEVQASATVPLTLGADADGTVEVAGSASVALSLGIQATGSTATTVEGSASVPLTLGLQATGGVEVAGSASVPLTLGLQATGGVEVAGSASVPLSLGVQATGGAEVAGSASVPLSIGIQATGGAEVAGSASVPLSIGIQATGTVSGSEITGTGVVALTLGVQATGGVQVAGTASVALVLGVQATGENAAAPQRRATGWRRVLYDPEGAEKAADEGRDDLGPREAPEARPLPELPELPESRAGEPQRITLPSRRKPAAKSDPVDTPVVDDEDEVHFILNIVIDLD